MNKKEYQQPQVTTVKIGLSDNIMDNVPIITGSSTTTQFSRRGSRCWEDDEDEEDW